MLIHVRRHEIVVDQRDPHGDLATYELKYGEEKTFILDKIFSSTCDNVFSLCGTEKFPRVKISFKGDFSEIRPKDYKKIRLAKKLAELKKELDVSNEEIIAALGETDYGFAAFSSTYEI